MHQLNDQNRLTVYANPARDLIVVQGNSGVVYPFYKSSGVNSKSDQTWSPWMGFFDHHPLKKENPNQLYMVKPDPSTVSVEAQGIIRKYLGGNADNFINRMGNDEALAISCSLGGGDWDKYPLLRQEIMQAQSTKAFIKELQVDKVISVDLKMPVSKDLVHFNGAKCSGEVLPAHAVMATAMETITAKVTAGYVTAFSVQDKKKFPTTDEVNVLMATKLAKPIPSVSAVEIRVPLPKGSGPLPSNDPPQNNQALQLEEARRIRERYLSKLGIVKDKYKQPEVDKREPDPDPGVRSTGPH